MSSGKPFAFKSSALSSAADQLWSASKKEFKAGDTSVKLDLGTTLADKTKANSRQNEPSNTSRFVFGSKITERVIVDSKDGEKGYSGNGVFRKESDESDQPKTASAVFEKIIKKASCSSSQSSSGDGGLVVSQENDGASTSLKTKDSAGHEDSFGKDSQPKANNVVISTGEENELNVHHASCKIYAFDPTQKKFIERGLANLRINRCQDGETTIEHRIVGRVSGNQRVIINSRVFPNMLLEKISPKRLKFSAQTPESELPLIFLAMASEFIIEQLYMILSEIVDKAKEVASRKRKVSNGNDVEEESSPKKAALESASKTAASESTSW